MNFPAVKNLPAVVLASAAAIVVPVLAQTVSDPGPRAGAAGAGGQIAGLTVKEAKFFDAGLDSFGEVSSVTGSVPGTEEGLGPRFNLNSCAGCHAHPAVGGTSPAANPQVLGGVAQQSQIDNLLNLHIIKADGPARDVRFKSDGGVHDLFTIIGLPGTPAGCTLDQPAFGSAELRFRIPTPVFGAGLIEAIEDSVIAAQVHPGKPYGITGHEN